MKEIMLVHRSSSFSLKCAVQSCHRNSTYYSVMVGELRNRVVEQLIKDNLNLCEYHYNKYIKYYTMDTRVKICCNPFLNHRSKVKTTVGEITSDLAKTYDLIPGNFICYKCKIRLRKGDAILNRDAMQSTDIKLEIEGDYSEMNSETLNTEAELINESDKTGGESSQMFMDKELCNANNIRIKY